MILNIPDVVAFPTDAQSCGFFCALSTVLLKALRYREEEPVFCARNNCFCVDCGNCQSKTMLQRHHNQLYHQYQTITGAGLLWAFPEAYDLDYIMGAAGLAFRRYTRTDGREAVLDAIAESVDGEYPVLMKLGGGEDWHVVTGYDEGGTLYGFDAHTHHALKPVVQADAYLEDGRFALKNWYDPFVEAVVITGPAEQSVRFCDMVRRMVRTLGEDDNRASPEDALHSLDTVNVVNAAVLADRLNSLAGFAAEARWHAAECFGSPLFLLAQSDRERQNLYYRDGSAVSQYLRAHDICWEIWGTLGVGPKTGYRTTPESAQLVVAERETLKRLFSELFDKDHAVQQLLEEIE